MTTDLFFNALMRLVNDLSRQVTPQQRYQHLLQTLRALFPCDACALLKQENAYLIPMAIDGLSEDTLGRRFLIEAQPRLKMILETQGLVRFAADSSLPDPYDGLIDGCDVKLQVHDCMGVTLYIDDKAWGVLTFDALTPEIFDRINPQRLQAFIALTEATVKVANLIVFLKSRAKQVEQTLLEESDRMEMIGNSPPMQALIHEISIVAQSDLAVLVLGETGVGKELVAHQIHRLSTRSEQMMVYVNCAALPENIAESELFGHTKGAFSGATSDRMGKFELAHEGTIFLDEIGELPLSLQAKILRTLQNGEIQRVGSDLHIQVDIRVIAATNRDLAKSVTAGHFRPDLYHRLAVYPISVPPLRNRGKDILLIAGLFLEKNKQRLAVQGLRLENKAKKALMLYPWPGNIRELEHLLSRAALKAVAINGHQQRVVTISCQHLDLGFPQEIQPLMTLIETPTVEINTDLKSQVDAFKKQVIVQALEKNHYNKSKTAEHLGLDRGNLHRLLERLQIPLNR